jgi:hypothetical protein
MCFPQEFTCGSDNGKVLSDNPNDNDHDNDDIDMDMDVNDNVDDDEFEEEEEMIARVMEYHDVKSYSYQDFPFDYIQDPKLENWIIHQRDLFRKKALPTHKVEKYRLVLMALDEDDAKWLYKYSQWKENRNVPSDVCKNKSNSFLSPVDVEATNSMNSIVPCSTKGKELDAAAATMTTTMTTTAENLEMKKWAKRQRKHYKQKKLSTVRERLLRQVGFLDKVASSSKRCKEGGGDSKSTPIASNLIDVLPSSREEPVHVETKGTVTDITMEGNQIAYDQGKKSTATATPPSSSHQSAKVIPPSSLFTVTTVPVLATVPDHRHPPPPPPPPPATKAATADTIPLGVVPRSLFYCWNYYFQQLKVYKANHCPKERIIPPTMDGADPDLQYWVEQQRRTYHRKNHFLEIGATMRQQRRKMRKRNSSRLDSSDDPEEDRDQQEEGEDEGGKKRFWGTRQNHIDLIRRGLLTSIGFNWNGRDDHHQSVATFTATTIADDVYVDVSNNMNCSTNRNITIKRYYESYTRKCRRTISYKENDDGHDGDGHDDEDVDVDDDHFDDDCSGNEHDNPSKHKRNVLEDNEDEDEYGTESWWKTKESKNKASNVVIWVTRFKQLKAFLTERNLTQMPYPFYCSDSILRGWVRTQRATYRGGTLPDHRYKLLDALGMHWEPDAPLGTPYGPSSYDPQQYYQASLRWANRQKEWLLKYNAVLSFLKKMKYTTIPDPFLCRDESLSSWLRTQRHVYKSGSMCKEREKLLNDIGMRWVVRKGRSIHPHRPRGGTTDTVIGVSDEKNHYDNGSDVDGTIKRSKRKSQNSMWNEESDKNTPNSRKRR